MDKILKITAEVIGKIAEMGAGLVSMGILFEPEVPEELKK